jgi:gallidermin/nisin family lantibiotic
MADETALQTKNDLARAHHEAAAQHDEAAHHHRQTAFYLSAGDSATAKQHAVAALEHGKYAVELDGQTDDFEDYDLDVTFESMASRHIHEEITSISLCTPGCKHGTFESFCCAAHTEGCTVGCGH